MRFHNLRLLFFYLCSAVLIVTILVICSNSLHSHFAGKPPVVISKRIMRRNISNSYWRYVCTAKRICQRTRVNNKFKLKGYGLRTCQMLCEKPTLWPIPKRMDYDKRATSSFKVESFSLRHNVRGSPIEGVVKKAFVFFNKNVFRSMEGRANDYSNSLKLLIIKLKIADKKLTKLRLNTSEEYKLESKKSGDELVIEINSETFFGARHGLETLSQLIWWDDIQSCLMILHDIEIDDEPAFPYRGLMIDTARNYFSLKSLKRNLRAMAACKLNVFHWHLTDSQSFPFVAPRFPMLGKYGSYDKKKIYTAEDVKSIIKYALPLGIRVIIEVDAPAHMYEGWRQLNEEYVFLSTQNGSGQLNPDSENVWSILRLLYEDILRLTDDRELFHIGGDEVDVELWLNTSRFNAINEESEKNTEYDDIFEKAVDLWVEVLSKIISITKSVTQSKYIILWSSDVMQWKQFIDNIHQSNIIVQHWLGNLDVIKVFRYKVIFSDVNAWYLDCGYGQWSSLSLLGEQHCTYNSWDRFYSHSPWNQVDIDRVLGGEACMWSEVVGEKGLDAKIWPRTAAFSEAVWSAPHLLPDVINFDVFVRLDVHIKRLRSRGIKTQTIWPEWCSQHPGYCM